MQYLIFVNGLTSSKESEIRLCILSKLEQDQKWTLQSVAEECQQILNLKHKTDKIEGKIGRHLDG